jgi:hypothetical protein
MTQTNPIIPQSAPSHADSAADSESLLHLHKMSTTAGVGSQDYVAVNVTSVIAVLFGLASLLAIASPVLLVFPIVGVGLSLLALRQVRHSNGTQTGSGLAILGLILSGLITTAIFSYQGYQVMRRRSDEQAVAALVQKYGDLLNQHKFAEAYDLFDSDFQNRVSKPIFIVHLTDIQKNPLAPPIDSISWNGLAVFHVDDADIETADSVMKIHYKGFDDEPTRNEIHLKRSGGGPWLIDNIPDQFPPVKPQPQ